MAEKDKARQDYLRKTQKRLGDKHKAKNEDLAANTIRRNKLRKKGK